MIGFEVRLIAWLLALASAVGGFWLFVRHERQVGAQACRDAQVRIEAKATEDARRIESDWLTNTTALTEVHNDELRRIQSRRAAQSVGLRNRPDVRAPDLPEAAASATNATGATGGHLSRPDAEFLVGFAAAADRVAADLRACQAWIETVKATPGLRQGD